MVVHLEFGFILSPWVVISAISSLSFADHSAVSSWRHFLLLHTYNMIVCHAKGSILCNIPRRSTSQKLVRPGHLRTGSGEVITGTGRTVHMMANVFTWELPYEVTGCSGAVLWKPYPVSGCVPPFGKDWLGIKALGFLKPENQSTPKPW